MPAAAFGQGKRSEVTLRIRPHVGDTIYMKMDQRFEMTGDTVRDGASGKGMAASMRVFTRAIVTQRLEAATELVSITDSVVVTPAAAAALPLFAQTKRALEGHTVHLRVGTDGGITLVDARHPLATQPVFATVPAVLPERPVAAGASWVRDLLIPLSATHAITGLIRVTFHLDSLGPEGSVAYLSLHGTVTHDHANDELGTHGHTVGTLTGTMQLDRRLDWVTDSRTTVTLTSTVTHPGERHETRVHMKVTQCLRAIPGS